ncbi:MAG: molecular chaperone TorD family protein [Thermodesulfobacteriota bacterium]
MARNHFFQGSEIDSSLMGRQAEERTKVYVLLSTFYLKKPGGDFVEKLQHGDFLGHLQSITSQIDGELAEALKVMERFIKSSKGMPQEELAEDLAVDFTRLFRGIKPGYGPSPPYESIYKGEGRIVGESTLEVMKMYDQSNVAMTEECAGPPDYIGTELKFLAMLCYKESEAWRTNHPDHALEFLRTELIFLDKHVCRWVPKFCRLMKKEARSNFYKGIAGLTNGFLTLDREQIHATLEGFERRN